jgi:hypothetical protein
MDPDQDLLDQLDRREGISAPVATVMTVGFALIVALISYFTFRLELHAVREVAFDGAGLLGVGSIAAILFAYRKLR